MRDGSFWTSFAGREEENIGGIKKTGAGTRGRFREAARTTPEETLSAEATPVYGHYLHLQGQRPRKLRTDAGTITTGMGASSGLRTGYQSSREAVNGLGESGG